MSLHTLSKTLNKRFELGLGLGAKACRKLCKHWGRSILPWVYKFTAVNETGVTELTLPVQVGSQLCRGSARGGCSVCQHGVEALGNRRGHQSINGQRCLLGQSITSAVEDKKRKFCTSAWGSVGFTLDTARHRFSFGLCLSDTQSTWNKIACFVARCVYVCVASCHVCMCVASMCVACCHVCVLVSTCVLQVVMC
jgi:hypothetical protein